MEFVAFWLLVVGYLLIYWGQYMVQGQHVSMSCLALGRC